MKSQKLFLVKELLIETQVGGMTIGTSKAKSTEIETGIEKGIETEIFKRILSRMDKIKFLIQKRKIPIKFILERVETIEINLETIPQKIIAVTSKVTKKYPLINNKIKITIESEIEIVLIQKIDLQTNIKIIMMIRERTIKRIEMGETEKGLNKIDTSTKTDIKIIETIAMKENTREEDNTKEIDQKTE